MDAHLLLSIIILIEFSITHFARECHFATLDVHMILWFLSHKMVHGEMLEFTKFAINSYLKIEFALLTLENIIGIIFDTFFW